MTRTPERGSAIIMLFVALALFGLITYTLLQGSRGNTNMIKGEADKAAASQAQDCANAISLGMKRLNARSCGTLVSTASDGSNPNAGAPADGSCSLYHPNGGGVKSSCAPTPTCDLTTLAIGADCGGVVYAGLQSGVRVYTTRTDAGVSAWNNGSTSSLATGVTNTSNGFTNTNTLLGLSNGHTPYAAAALCRGLGGEWYLPAKDELALFYTNRTAIGNFSTGGTLGDGYLSSTEMDGTRISLHIFNGNTVFGSFKQSPARVRCARR